MFLNELVKLTKVFADGRFVESLSTFGVKTRWPSKLNLWVPSKKASGPFVTRLCSAESLSLHSDRLFVKWMGCVREENDPVNESPLSFR